MKKTPNFKGKIDIEIISNYDYIVVKLTDNGTGITNIKKVMTPYFTTKTKGTGLGLPIVSKIINEHSGDFLLKNNKDGDGVNIEILDNSGMTPLMHACWKGNVALAKFLLEQVKYIYYLYEHTQKKYIFRSSQILRSQWTVAKSFIGI